MPHEAFCRREPSMFLDAFRGPFAFYGFSCGPCCSEEFRCVVPGGATSNQNDSNGGEFVPHPPHPIFQALVLDPIPFLGCHMQPISRKCHIFFCFTSLPDRPCVHVFCSFYAFLGVGGALGSAKEWAKIKHVGFFTPTHTPRAHECLLNSSLIL